MIERITFERLYNLGGYENLRLTATAIVETTVEEAFAEAKLAVEDQHAAYLAEQAEARRREQERHEAGMARRRAEAVQRQAEWAAEQKRRGDEPAAQEADETEPWFEDL